MRYCFTPLELFLAASVLLTLTAASQSLQPQTAPPPTKQTTCDESYLTVTGSSVECTNHNFVGSNCTITCNLAGTAYGFDYSGASSGESSGEPPVGEELYDEEQQEYDQEYDYNYDSYVSRHVVVCGPDGAWTDERPVCLPDVNFTYDDDDDSSLNYDDFLEEFGEQELERPLETSDQRDCELEKDAGVCRAMIPRWFYDASSGSCRLFIFGGCGGNGNNFVTQFHCEKLCARS